jgi:hypothetical protein
MSRRSVCSSILSATQNASTLSSKVVEGYHDAPEHPDPQGVDFAMLCRESVQKPSSGLHGAVNGRLFYGSPMPPIALRARYLLSFYAGRHLASASTVWRKGKKYKFLRRQARRLGRLAIL